MSSILQPWVETIGLRHQGVLLSAMRGCDIAPFGDHSKICQRLLRGAVLIPHCGRFVKPSSYITWEDDRERWWKIMQPLLDSHDHYPNHYVVHFLHASEVIAYHGPQESPVHSDRWLAFYEYFCEVLHLNPETKEQMDRRLNADEKAFSLMQRVNPLASRQA